MRRLLLMIAGLAAALAWPGAAAAQTAQLSAFAGSWNAVDLTEGPARQQLGVVGEDLGVTVTPEGSGFTLYWTEYRFGGLPGASEIRREPVSLRFEASRRPGFFQAGDSGNPLDGEVLSWARLHDSALTVYRMRLNGEGGYILATYDRVLEGDLMRVDLRIIADDAPVMQVTGRLARTGG